jgi:bifunctional non-homologous end joining protein LigD
MLATPGRAPFSAAGWLFEIKYDGVRVRAARRGEEVTLLGRSGQNVTARYPEIVRALRALPLPHFLIDGEIVALDEGGRPSFQRLQARMALTEPREVERAAARVPATAVFFDCLGLDGFDLRRLPLAERKECLRLLLPTRGVIRYGGRGLLRGGLGGAPRGHPRQARGQPLHGRALARLDQAQVPPATGLRRRRLHRSPGHARVLRRAPPRALRG